MTLKFKHNISSAIKKAPTGFSWTCLFFGFFVPLLRGDVKWLFLTILLATVSGGIFWLVCPFIYNKIYIQGLLENGYLPDDENSKNYLKYKGLIA